MSFKKFPPEDKWFWYVEGLRRNPQFRAECDAAVQYFLENYYSKDELKILQGELPELFSNPLKSPHVQSAFVQYSPEAQTLGERWGLVEAWHYDSPEFPPPRDYYVAYLKPFKEIKNTAEDSYDARHNPEKYYLDDNGMIHIIINPKASKKEIRDWVNDLIDEIRIHQPRGISTSDTETIFKIYDMRKGGKKPWQIAQELFPRIRGLSPGVDLEAKRGLKTVTDALRKASKIIESIKPLE